MRKTSFSDLGKHGDLWSNLSERAPTQPLHHIKHLKLDLTQLKFPQENHENMMKYIIDSLFWMARPMKLTLSLPTTSFNALAYVMP